MGADVRDFYRSDRTCCLIIPLFHVGIYSLLGVNLALSLFAAVMSFAGPAILTLTIPMGLSMGIGALYILLAALHVMAIVSVYRNQIQPFRIAKNFGAFVLGVIFVISIATIIMSASEHNKAIKQCLDVFSWKVDTLSVVGSAGTPGGVFGSVGATSDATRLTVATTICSIFGWAQVGTMAIVWAIMAGVQLYFALKSKVYFKLKLEDALEDAKV